MPRAQSYDEYDTCDYCGHCGDDVDWHDGKATWLCSECLEDYDLDTGIDDDD